jgi:8-oxo-dGTP pyrophosphatase MutT (NUDIX family)
VTGPRSFGIIPVRKFSTEYRFLLVRAYANWDFPKGRIDPGEEPLACALRELREEATLEGAIFPWGEEFVETAPYSHGKIARYYLAELAHGEVNLPVSEELGKPENDEFRWVTGDEAERLLPGRLQSVLRWAREKLKSDTRL